MNSKQRRFIARVDKRRAYTIHQKNDALMNSTQVTPKMRIVKFFDGFATKEVTRKRNQNGTKKSVRKNLDTSMTPSLPKARRASGLMSKHRRMHQKAISNSNGIEMYRDLTLAQQIIQY